MPPQKSEPSTHEHSHTHSDTHKHSHTRQQWIDLVHSSLHGNRSEFGARLNVAYWTRSKRNGNARRWCELYWMCLFSFSAHLFCWTNGGERGIELCRPVESTLIANHFIAEIAIWKMAGTKITTKPTENYWANDFFSLIFLFLFPTERSISLTSKVFLFPFDTVFAQIFRLRLMKWKCAKRMLLLRKSHNPNSKKPTQSHQKTTDALPTKPNWT